MRTLHCLLPQKPGGQAPKPALPFPPHARTGHSTCNFRLRTHRWRELGHGRVAIRLWVSWLVTGGVPRPCLPPPAEHSCPAWHHLLCPALSHLTLHLTLIPCDSMCTLMSTVLGTPKPKRQRDLPKLTPLGGSKRCAIWTILAEPLGENQILINDALTY